MEDILNFDIPIHQSSYIKVIGVGGGGSNAVNHMFQRGIKGVDFIVCNTDAAALDGSPVPNKIQLGRGLGAGNVPTVAERAAREKAHEISSVFENNTQMVFITAGMGGGTGTGAAPVVAELLKKIELDDEEVKNILTIAVVTTPFEIEGHKRKQQAQDGIAELRKHVDAILIINDEKLNDFGDMPMSQAFGLANEILTTAVKGISEIMTVNSDIHIDFRDVNTVMRNSGVALMGVGSAEGEDRAMQAISQAISSPLLNDNDIKGAKNVLLYISSSSEHEVTMSEFKEITNFVQKATGRKMDMIWGKGFDDSLGDKISITLVATGFSEKEIDNELKLEVFENWDEEIHPSAPKNQPKIIPIDDEEAVSTTVLPVHYQEDKMDEISMVEKSEKTIEPNSLEDSLNSYKALSPSKQITGEFPLNDEPYLANQKTVASAANTTSIPNSEYFQAHSVERIQHLRELSAMTKTPEGLAALERMPAYLRRGTKLEELVHPSTSEAPRYNLTEDGRMVKNSYLNDNVD